MKRISHRFDKVNFRDLVKNSKIEFILPKVAHVKIEHFQMI